MSTVDARVSPPSLYSRPRNRMEWTVEIAWGKGSNGSRAWSGLMERADAVPAVGPGRARAVPSCAASSTGTRQAVPGRFRAVLYWIVLGPARLDQPVWPSILACSECTRMDNLLALRRVHGAWAWACMNRPEGQNSFIFRCLVRVSVHAFRNQDARAPCIHARSGPVGRLAHVTGGGIKAQGTHVHDPGPRLAAQQPELLWFHAAYLLLSLGKAT